MERLRSLSPEIDACLEAAVSSGGVTPGAVLLVSVGGEILHHRAYGHAQRLPDPRPLTLDTLFDVASLTKVMAATAATMVLIEAGKLSLEEQVCQYLPDFRGEGREKVTVSDLLIHGSGMGAWRGFYKEILDGQAAGGPNPGTPEARAKVFAEVRQSPLTQRRGSAAVYSDLGFLLLTQLLETVSGDRLDHFCDKHLFSHLGLKDTFFLPLDAEVPRNGRPEAAFAATEFSHWLGRYLVGEVHDDNCHVMGGVSGHAGLFSTATDIHTFACTLLKAFQGQRGLIYSPEIVREFWRRRVFSNGSMRAYGWDVPTPGQSSSGKHFSELSFGHLGFTGTSIWIDAAREVVVILLTNRVHPTRDNEKIKTLRPVIHDLVMEKLLADRFSGRSSANVSFTQDEEDLWNVIGTSIEGAGQERSTPRLRSTTQSEGKPGATLPKPPREPVHAVWFKCKACRYIMYRPELEKNRMVCPNCNYHHYLPCLDRIRLLADDNSFVELDTSVSPTDPLNFFDSKSYKERLLATQRKLGVKDAFRSGRCTIGGHPCQIGAFDFSFMGGSMGSVVGEKVTRIFERAVEEGSGAIVVSASGGARMQEGVLSLMQMAKSCAALARMKTAGLPYISILTHPTTGGVAASFAMLGDVNLAEPTALIGFAGPRVIEQTIRQKLPEGFQRSEYLLEHGMIDIIVERKEMRKTVSSLYGMLKGTSTKMP